MKKIKYLTLLSLSLFMLTGCAGDVHRDIEREVRDARIITNVEQQNFMFEAISRSQIAPRDNNNHVLSVDAEFNIFGVSAFSIATYGYYNYNAQTNKSSFNLESTGLSSVKVNIDEEQKLNAALNLISMDVISYEDVQLTFEPKPLNELIDFSTLLNLDRTLIKEYRETMTIDLDYDRYDYGRDLGTGYQGYVFVLDANKVNEMLNSTIKFNSDPVLTFLSRRRSFDNIEILHLSGSITLSGNISAGLQLFIYNVPAKI